MCDEVPDIDEGVRRWFYGGTPAAGDYAAADEAPDHPLTPGADPDGHADRTPARGLAPSRPHRTA